jgi:hypothetical protein
MALPSLAHLALEAACALLIAATLTLVSWATETVNFQALRWLERCRCIERLIPSVPIPPDAQHFKLQTVKVFLGSSWVVAMVALHFREPLMTSAQPRWGLLEVRDGRC